MLENEMLNVDAKTGSWKFLEPAFTLIQVVRFFGFILLLFLEFSSQDILQICRFMHGHMGSLCQLKKAIMHVNYYFASIAEHTKSKNRIQITEFPAGLSQRKRVLREIQGM